MKFLSNFGLVGPLAVLLVGSYPRPGQADSESAVLVLSHGGSAVWDKSVKKAVKALKKHNKDVLAVSVLDDESVKRLGEELVKRLQPKSDEAKY